MIATVKSTLRKLKSQIGNLWQSKDSNYAQTSGSAKFLFLVGAVCLAFFLLFKSCGSTASTFVPMLIFGYFAVFFFLLAVILLYLSFYVNNSCKAIARFQKFFFIILVLLLALLAIVLFPLIPVYIFAVGAFKAGARHIDDLLCGMISILFTVALLLLLLSVLDPRPIASAITEFRNLLASLNYSLNNIDAVIYFVLFSLLLLASWLIEPLICKVVIWLQKIHNDKDYVTV